MIEDTGERFIPGISSERLREEHIARYVFAQGLVLGKRVLDMGCGTGYGSRMLCVAGAREVVGMDISSPCIAHAIQEGGMCHLTFTVGSAAYIPYPDSYFDMVVLFEVIEHLHHNERAAAFAEIHRVLAPHGNVLLSTPNKVVTSPHSDTPLNPFHAVEFIKEHLMWEMALYFSIISWHGQRFIPNFLTAFPVRKAIELFHFLTGYDTGIYSRRPSPAVRPWRRHQPKIFVVIGKK